MNECMLVCERTLRAVVIQVLVMKFANVYSEFLE